MLENTTVTRMTFKTFLVLVLGFAAIFVALFVILTIFVNPKEDKAPYPGQIGYIHDRNNSDLAPVGIIISLKDGMYSYKTIFGEPIIFYSDSILLTTTDSGKTWHDYSFIDPVDQIESDLGIIHSSVHSNKYWFEFRVINNEVVQDTVNIFIDLDLNS